MKNIIKSSIAVLTLALGAGVSHAATITYLAILDGPSEFPANASPGTGLATITVDDVAKTIGFDIAFSGLLGTTTAAHIHAATAVPGVANAGVATQTSLVGFPLGVNAGTFNNTLDMTLAASFNPAYVTAHGGTTAQAFADLNQAIVDGKAYFNIHTASPLGFPGGEIRGFLAPAPVPEPAAMSLLAAGSVLGLVRRRRK